VPVCISFTLLQSCRGYLRKVALTGHGVAIVILSVRMTVLRQAAELLACALSAKRPGDSVSSHVPRLALSLCDQHGTVCSAPIHVRGKVCQCAVVSFSSALALEVVSQGECVAAQNSKNSVHAVKDKMC
jgi:hypothetical protein